VVMSGDDKSLPTRCKTNSALTHPPKRYTAATIDWLAVYDATTKRIFYVPAAELGSGMYVMHLRLAPARNNQRARVRMAEDYVVPTIRPMGL
jgi:hypothetical protein